MKSVQDNIHLQNNYVTYLLDLDLTHPQFEALIRQAAELCTLEQIGMEPLRVLNKKKTNPKVLMMFLKSCEEIIRNYIKEDFKYLFCKMRIVGNQSRDWWCSRLRSWQVLRSSATRSRR